MNKTYNYTTPCGRFAYNSSNFEKCPNGEHHYYNCKLIKKFAGFYIGLRFEEIVVTFVNKRDHSNGKKNILLKIEPTQSGQVICLYDFEGTKCLSLEIEDVSV